MKRLRDETGQYEPLHLLVYVIVLILLVAIVLAVLNHL